MLDGLQERLAEDALFAIPQELVDLEPAEEAKAKISEDVCKNPDHQPAGNVLFALATALSEFCCSNFGSHAYIHRSICSWMLYALLPGMCACLYSSFLTAIFNPEVRIEVWFTCFIDSCVCCSGGFFGRYESFCCQDGECRLEDFA